MAKWRRPNVADDRKSFERAAFDFRMSLDELNSYLDRGKLERLDGYTWCRLDNTDSNDTFSLVEAERVAARLGEDLSVVTLALSREATLPAPVVLDRAEPGRPYLMTGNLCLVACRSLNVTPMVWRLPAPKQSLSG